MREDRSKDVSQALRKAIKEKESMTSISPGSQNKIGPKDSLLFIPN